MKKLGIGLLLVAGMVPARAGIEEFTIKAEDGGCLLYARLNNAGGPIPMAQIEEEKEIIVKDAMKMAHINPEEVSNILIVCGPVNGAIFAVSIDRDNEKQSIVAHPPIRDPELIKTVKDDRELLSSRLKGRLFVATDLLAKKTQLEKQKVKPAEEEDELLQFLRLKRQIQERAERKHVLATGLNKEI